MSKEKELLLQKVRLYASGHQMTLVKPLGFGTHGTVFSAKGNPEFGRSAIKIHSDQHPYLRERMVYERLAENGVLQVEGFKIPELLRADDTLLVIEMTIVTR